MSFCNKHESKATQLEVVAEVRDTEKRHKRRFEESKQGVRNAKVAVAEVEDVFWPSTSS